MQSLNHFRSLPHVVAKSWWRMGLLAFLLRIFLPAQAQQTSPQQLVQQVIHNELTADQNDHSLWMYRDFDKVPSKSTVTLVVQTAQGTVSKTIELNGHPLTPQQRAQDEAKMQSVVSDPAVRAKQHKNSAHDDQQSTALLKMLPYAFLWTETGQSNGEITLHFLPNPAFQPPNYASRVFAAMAGEMIVDEKQKRLKVLSGKLIQPVEFAWGLFGKLNPGGTFRVVRSEIAPGEWQITETHVHIQGHMLIFKSINEQQDDVTSDYKPVSPALTLERAAKMLTDGTVAKELGILQK